MRVLAAEDNPVFQSMLKTMLTKWGYQAVIARSGTEAWRVLESEDAPRLAVLDWMMPGMDGLEICRRIRSANREPYIYILLLTARTESQDLIEGMDAGADDYLTKPFNAHELRVRLHAGRRILDLQEELLKAREALREQATHDGLTGLLNRTGILEKLDDELSRVVAYRHSGFGPHGRSGPLQVDQRYLRPSGRRCRAPRSRTPLENRCPPLRFRGSLWRRGIPHCAPRLQRRRGRHTRRTHAPGHRRRPLPVSRQPVLVTASLGVACSSHGAPEALVREADDALYLAKENGRNRVVVHCTELSDG